ncbi:MAG: cytochrome b [Betaproteobacteria bacterium]|nr:cytochrome b [Betaproteobacteria bacterium]
MSPARYTGTAIALHWLAALLILGNVAFGLYMVDLPLSPSKLRYYSWHKWVGVTVFLLSAARLLWRLSHRAPALPASMPPWQHKAASLSHGLLYVLFFAAPLSGWLFSSAAGFPTVYLGLVQLPDLLAKNRELADVLKVVHRGVTWSLAGLAILHAAAAIKHHVVDRDDVLHRMLPFIKPGT